MDVKLLVANLAPSTTEKSLRQLFAQAGTVTAIHLLPDRSSSNSKGFAHVTMASQAEAQKAIDLLHESTQAGQPITVNLARPRAAAAENQGRLGAFGSSDQGGKANPRKPGQPRGGYQSKLGAFG